MGPEKRCTSFHLTFIHSCPGSHIENIMSMVGATSVLDTLYACQECMSCFHDAEVTPVFLLVPALHLAFWTCIVKGLFMWFLDSDLAGY